MSSDSIEHKDAVTRTIWAAMMLTPKLEVLLSILHNQPVLARGLDRIALRRALRGGELPEDDEYVTVTDGMLYAVHEAGGFEVKDDGVSLREPPRR